MRYRELQPWKYQITEMYSIGTDILFKDFVRDHEFIYIDPTGLIVLSPYYSWDGATCFPDIPSIMRGSLIHDALTQLMKEGILSNRRYRKQADQLLKKICIEDGMSKWLANMVYLGVRSYSSIRYGG